MMNTNIIHELQSMAIETDLKLTPRLMKAKIIASKLDLEEFLSWINSELDDYSSDMDIPEYRTLSSSLQGWHPYHGWQHVPIQDEELAELICTVHLRQGIASLEGLLAGDGNSLSLQIAPTQKSMLLELVKGATEFRLPIARGQVENIIHQVRSLLLDWSLKLEKSGISVEELTFTEKDKEKSQTITQIFYAHNINNVGNVSDSATVNQTAKINIDINKTQEIISQIEKFSDELPEPAKQEFILVKKELEQKEPDVKKITSKLTTLKEICIGASGNLVAQGVVSLLKNLL